MSGVRGRHVLVTGATKGTGRMIVQGFHAEGAVVHVNSRHPEDCLETVFVFGEPAVAVPGDVSTVAGCNALPTQIAEHSPKLDILVNNAGTTWGADLVDYPDAAWDDVLAVNLKAPFHLTVACLDLLREAASPSRPSWVINIGSVDGLHVPLWQSYAYSSSKAGLHHLTRHLAERLASDGITVNARSPTRS